MHWKLLASVFLQISYAAALMWLNCLQKITNTQIDNLNHQMENSEAPQYVTTCCLYGRVLLHFHGSARRLRAHTFNTGTSCSTTCSNWTITHPLNLTSLSDRCQPLSHRRSDKDAPDKRSSCRGRHQHVRFAAPPRNTMSQSIWRALAHNAAETTWSSKPAASLPLHRSPHRGVGLRACEESLTSIKQRNPESSTRPPGADWSPSYRPPGQPRSLATRSADLANEPQPAKSLFIGRGRWKERSHRGMSLWFSALGPMCKKHTEPGCRTNKSITPFEIEMFSQLTSEMCKVTAHCSWVVLHILVTHSI